jgi:hypothetical protein
MLKHSTVGLVVSVGIVIVFGLNAIFGFLVDGIGKSLGYVAGGIFMCGIFVLLRKLECRNEENNGDSIQ